MKIERTKNAARNIFFGSMQKLYQMIIPFMMRTAMIYFIGVKYLGLNSLFTSILQVLNLAELGVGSAMVYGMYKPIAEDDTVTICALMRLYRLYYRLIGSFIAIVGILVTPLIPRLVSGGIPSELNLQILYLLNLAATVSSYWLFAYKNCLLIAYQRNDVTSKITMGINTIQYILQFYVLCFIKNYYAYLIITLLSQISINITTSFIVSKMYPNLKAVGKLDKQLQKEINIRIKDLFISKIGGVTLNSVDTIVMSAFLGLTILAIYQNYFFIITSVIGLVEIILASITAGIGNSFVLESKEKNYRDMKKLTFLFMWLIGVCTCCFLGLYQPFMKIWMGEELQLPYSVVICLCIYFLCYEFTRLLNIFKDAAGVWHEDRFRPLVSAAINLSLNLVMVRFLGVYGIILSTVIALGVIEIPWLLHNIFTVMYEHSLLKDYLKKISFYFIIILFACLVTGLLTVSVHLSDWSTLIICLVICCLVPNIIFLLSYHKKDEFSQSLQLVDRITQGKIKF